MKQKFVLAVIVCLCVIMNLQNAIAEDGKTFTVGVEAVKYFPQYDNDTNNEYLGFARDFLDSFAKSRGYKFVYELRPIKRLFSDFLEQNLDFKYPDSPYWQKEMKVNIKVVYSDSVVQYTDGIMVLPENKGKEIKEFKLGTMRGFSPFPCLDLIASGKMVLSENNTFTALLQQALIQRINGAYINVAVAKYQLSEVLKQPGGLVFDDKLPSSKDFYYFSTIKHPKVIEELNEFLKTEKTAIDALKKRYGVDVIE